MSSSVGGTEPDEAGFIEKLESRIKVLQDFLGTSGVDVRQQRHLDEGTVERAYWHYGYMVALRDVLRLWRRLTVDLA